MTITDINVSRIYIPLKEPFVTAVRTAYGVEALRVVLHTSKDKSAGKVEFAGGLSGYGEAPATALITGETLASIKEAIVRYIGPAILGRDITEDLSSVIQKAIYGNNSAKAAVEMAWLDLKSQKMNLPLYKMLGDFGISDETRISETTGLYGRQIKPVKLTNDITISVGPTQNMVTSALSAIDSGFEILKIKTGKSPETDARQIIDFWKGLEEGLGQDLEQDLKRDLEQDLEQGIGQNKKITLRIDANQGWSPQQAIKIIHDLEDSGIPIDLIEQPVPFWDLDGMAAVQAHSSLPIVADESVFSYWDAVECIKRKAARIINIKLMKTGGIGPALEICKLCKSHGLECMIGCMMESQIGAAAAAHLAAASVITDVITDVITRIDLDSPLLAQSGFYSKGPAFNGPVIEMDNNPGIGTRPIINTNEAKIDPRLIGGTPGTSNISEAKR